MTRPRVVIIGAGFGGLNAAKQLARAPVDVLLIDRNNYHTFQPLLYQVATAALETGDIAYQVRGIFQHQANVGFRMGEVVGFDVDAREVLLQGGDRVAYDYLVLAAGAVYHDFGTPGVRENAFVIKSLERAGVLRSHILKRFEAAAVDHAQVEQGALTVVIVGAGPTGVEMAGALVELFDRVLDRDYRELDMRLARVVVIEAGAAVLPPFKPRSQRYAEKVLRRRGVDVRLGSAVAEVRANAVVLRSGEVIPTQTVVWAAGVRGHPVGEALAESVGEAMEKGRRLKVEPDLSLPGHPEIFAIGDVAAATDPDGNLLPQVAQVAIQAGKHVARTLVRRMQQRPAAPFRYFDLGSMAIIGRNAGVAELSRALLGLELRGFVGWLGWLFLHLIYLPGFRNRFSALFTWAYEYLTFDRHARLILTPRPDTWGVNAPPPSAPRDVAADGQPVDQVVT